jgi:uncharacterized repeat protein (TIGR03803 family)
LYLHTPGSATVLHSFAGRPGDGSRLESGLLRDSAGNLYGNAYTGGSGNCLGRGIVGCGIIFKLDAAGNETVLHSFSGPPDGAHPSGALVQDTSGNLYGVTYAGGSGVCYNVVGFLPTERNVGCGTIFKLQTTGN